MTSVYVAKQAFTNEMWNRPLSEFMPEFATQVKQQGLTPGLNATRWNEITPFALASQLGGLGQALPGILGGASENFITTFNLSFAEWIAGGMPSSFTELDALDPKYISACSVKNTTCTSEDYAAPLAWRDAFRLPFTEPGYSNAGFILFGIVMERLTNKTISELYREYLIEPLGLKSTFIMYPGNGTTNNCSNCVVTGNFDGFALENTPEWAVGSGNLMTTVDELAVIGASILNSTLLPPAETRKWLKPVSHTSNFEYSVGAPWEIVRYTNPVTGKITDIYPKSGDAGSAAAEFAIVPDFGAGFSIALSTSLPAFASFKILVVATIADLLLDIIMPALEAQASLEAQQKFAGTYAATGLNSSITIVSTPDRGLSVTSWISNGTNLCVEPYDASLGSLGCPFTLQQTNDLRSSSNSAGQIAFRPPMTNSGVFASADAARKGQGLFYKQWVVGEWFNSPATYTAGIGSNLFLFNVAAGGNVTSVSPAALRITLEKK